MASASTTALVKGSSRQIVDAIKDLITSTNEFVEEFPVGVVIDGDQAVDRLKEVWTDRAQTEFAQGFLERYIVPVLWANFLGRGSLQDYTIEALPSASESSKDVFAARAVSRSARDDESGDEDVAEASMRKAAERDRRIYEEQLDRLRSDRFTNQREAHAGALMVQGFEQLWQIFRKVEPIPGGAGMGRREAVLAPRLSWYMPLGFGATNSNLNTLFYAVEFGTGTAAKVGSPDLVRWEGPTKVMTGRNAGAWRYGPKEGGGTTYKGQLGFHFLWEVRGSRRVLNPEYENVFRAYAYPALKAFLTKRLG